LPNAGDGFGWARNPRHIHAAEAVTDVTLLSWPRMVAEEVNVADRTVGPRILALLFDQFVESQNHMLLLGRLHATERLATFLLARAQRHGHNSDHCGWFPLPIQRRDISDHLGLSLETVSRTMHDLKRRGLIDFAVGKSMQIRMPDKLERLANCCGD
jgi:CRP-like cAMP-binding protein